MKLTQLIQWIMMILYKNILKMNEEDYIKAIRSSINGPKIF